MIFMSYTHANKKIVHQIATKVAAVFGKKNIFYDTWSIQPGDGIIDKMNEGLKHCKYFFFFVSKESLASNMVKLEWQNALFDKTKNGAIKFIPVKLDNCVMPNILLQTLFIDVFNNGVDFATTQIIETIHGREIPGIEEKFHNIKAYITYESGSILNVEFRAEVYTEPQSKYIVMIENPKEQISSKAIGEGMFYSGFTENLKLDNGLTSHAVSLSRDAPTSPGFPFIVEIKTIDESNIILKTVLKAISSKRYETIPMIITRA